MNTMDWEKVEAFIKERKPTEVVAGLLDDWFWTAATVYRDGQWLDKSAAYVTSCWAVPGLKATMANGDVIEVVAAKEQTEAEAKEEGKQREERRRRAKEFLKETRGCRGDA